MFYWGGAVRSGVLIVVIIGVVMYCAVPVLKIAAFILIYKLTAALIQPICDARIVKAIDGAGNIAAVALSATVLVSVMFIFTAMILLS